MYLSAKSKNHPSTLPISIYNLFKKLSIGCMFGTHPLSILLSIEVIYCYKKKIIITKQIQNTKKKKKKMLYINCEFNSLILASILMILPLFIYEKRIGKHS